MRGRYLLQLQSTVRELDGFHQIFQLMLSERDIYEFPDCGLV